MFLPLHDANRLRFIRRQYVTWTIIVATVAVHALTSLYSPTEFDEIAAISLGYIPAVLNGTAVLPAEYVLLPEQATYLTYAFLHGDWMHLGVNMLFLWVFGDNVEDALGHLRFVAFYIACAAAGAWAHGLLAPNSEAPLIGASGAVAGVSAAYLILHPKVRLWTLVVYRIPLPLPAWIPLGVWVATQFVMILREPFGPISWAAHVGGIVMGAVLVLILRRPGVPLLDRRIVTPHAAVLAAPPGERR